MALAFAIGVGTQNSKKEWLEVFYQLPVYQPETALIEAAKSVGYTAGNQAIELDAAKLETLSGALSGEQAALAKKLTASKRPTVLTVVETDEQASSTPEVYLKLQLISHRMVNTWNRSKRHFWIITKRGLDQPRCH